MYTDFNLFADGGYGGCEYQLDSITGIDFLKLCVGALFLWGDALCLDRITNSWDVLVGIISL